VQAGNGGRPVSSMSTLVPGHLLCDPVGAEKSMRTAHATIRHSCMSTPGDRFFVTDRGRRQRASSSRDEKLPITCSQMAWRGVPGGAVRLDPARLATTRRCQGSTIADWTKRHPRRLRGSSRTRHHGQPDRRFDVSGRPGNVTTSSILLDNQDRAGRSANCASKGPDRPLLYRAPPALRSRPHSPLSRLARRRTDSVHHSSRPSATSQRRLRAT